MSMKLAVLAVVSASLGSIACGSSNSPGLSTGCSGTISSIQVAVVNDSCEPQNVCQGTVTATQGSTSVTLKPNGSTGNCTFGGDVSAAGTYTIVVNAPPYPTTTGTVTVQALGCSYTTSVDVMTP